MADIESIAGDSVAMSPQSFAPFDGLPLQVAVAWSEDFSLLWCNNEFAAQRESTPAELVGRSFYSILPGPAVEERRELLTPAIRDHRRVSYMQVWRGMRCLTRAWPLDMSAFAKRGCFVVTQPALFNGTTLPNVPMVRTPDLGLFEDLTDRELEVLYLLADGHSAKEVASMLHRSVRTIENHTGAIHAKLKITRRSELTRMVVEHGLLSFTPEQWASIIKSAA